MIEAPAHGILGLSTPWARAGIPAEERPAIEATIPHGYTIGVSGHAHGRGRVFVLWALGPAIDDDGTRPEVMRWPGRHDPVNAAQKMAQRLQALANDGRISVAGEG